jgi:hypothetical protein
MVGVALKVAVRIRKRNKNMVIYTPAQRRGRRQRAGISDIDGIFGVVF